MSGLDGMTVDMEQKDEFVILRKKKTIPAAQSQKSPSSEIEDYLCEERTMRGQKVNPLEYWKFKESQAELRGLCKLARRIFCATPTTAAVERIFSVTGFIVSRRTSLSDEMLEFLLLNHLNGDLRDFGGRVDGRKRKFKDVD